MSAQYPSDKQTLSGSFPTPIQTSAPGSGVWPDGGYKPQAVELFDPFFGYVGPIAPFS